MVETDLACRNGPRWPWTHVKLIGADDGKRYALPDVGEEPEYAVPTRAFHAERGDNFPAAASAGMDRELVGEAPR